jgi:aminopeptidase N
MNTTSIFVRAALFVPMLLGNTVIAQFTPGSRTVGDPYLPTIGNGGYDAQHYDLTINYDPVANTMISIAEITIQATQNLSEFSLDLRGFTNVTVTIDGVAAGTIREAEKLIVTPGAGIEDGRLFHLVVNYSGRPTTVPFLGTTEGWVRISGGAWVVNEPRGAMCWFPNNNDPSDKATYSFHITVPSTHTALGNGELASKVDNADGTTTWNWQMGLPMSSYLSTSTVGRFDYAKSISTNALGASGNPLEIHNAFESALPATQKTTAANTAARQDKIIQFISNEIGVPYPFESHGVVLLRSSVGYELEVQTKPHFPDLPIDPAVLAHEIAHQWFGDSVGPATWREVWFNEGWATWWTWYWVNKQNGNSTTVERRFTLNYTPEKPWNIAPANLVNASQMFGEFQSYVRPAIMLEAYRQVVGHATFVAFQRALLTEYAYSSISTEQFIALARRLAQERSGFPVSYLSRLDEFFQQWLYGRTRPSLTPATFFQELDPQLAIRTINASAQLQISWRTNNAPFFLEQADELNGDHLTWTRVAAHPVFNNGSARVTLARPPGNRFYRLQKE